VNNDDNDDTNVEPVDLSPTHAELIARVRARGRRIRARRRVMITGLTALVVVAIAVPAVAIGTRSSSHGVTPATTTRRTSDFRIAVIEHASNDTAATASSCVKYYFEKNCLTLGTTIATASDVRSASVVDDDTQGWIVNVEIDSDAVIRLAAQAGHQVAIIVNDRVVSAPVVNPGITGTTVTVSGALTRAQAIALATAAAGRAPSHVDSAPDLTASIELPIAPLVSGGSTRVTLVIVNHTAHAVSLTDRLGCPVQWRATLFGPGSPSTATLTARRGGTPCPTGSALAPGSNRIPVTVSAVLFCHSPAGSLTGVPACPANGAGPPLTSGDYELQVSGNSADAPMPPPVRIEVEAATVVR
jgi:hypothetical protein